MPPALLSLVIAPATADPPVAERVPPATIPPAYRGAATRGPSARRSRARASGALLAAAALLAGCHPQAAPPPSFLSRLQQDCLGGDPDACTFLASLQPQAPLSAEQPPPSAPRRRTQAQRNADAILQGMQRAHTVPRASQVVPDDPGS